MPVVRCPFAGRADHFRHCPRADIQVERLNGGPGEGLIPFSACRHMTGMPTRRGFAAGCSHRDGPPADLALARRRERPATIVGDATGPDEAA